MRKRTLATLLALALALAALVTACANDNDNLAASNNSASSSANSTASAIRSAPDNSEITTETAGGVTTETRTFKDPNSPIERVVVTTRDGHRTARVYYRKGEVRELPESDVERALDATGDTLVAAGGKVVDVSKTVGSEIGDKAEDVGDKAKDVGSEVGDKAEDVKDKTVSGAKAVGSETADKAEDVADKTASGAKKVGRTAKKGTKKAVNAVKDVIP